MPLVCLAVILLIMMSFFLNRTIKKQYSLVVHFCMSAIVLISGLYQFIHIAKYIDATGEKITNILGTLGSASLWGGLIMMAIQTLLLFFEIIAKTREASKCNDNKK